MKQASILSINVVCDYMRRRFLYRESVNNTVTRHERYLYRGYLQIAALDMLNAAAVIRTVVWDPTEPTATRPLLLSTPDGWFTYGFDQVKNVTELFDESGSLAATYDYSPFGEITAATGVVSAFNPIRFSSEVWDVTLGLVYYNWRHQNPPDGRFINRDRIGERGGMNLHGFVGNNPINTTDRLGEKTTIGTEGNWTYLTIWNADQYSVSMKGSLDVRVIYTMDDSERECCDAVHIDRYLRKFIMYGTKGPYVLDHATLEGYTVANGVAEDDHPEGPSFIFGLYRSSWSYAFKWIATCARGKNNGVVLSTLVKTYRTEGHFSGQPYSGWFED